MTGAYRRVYQKPMDFEWYAAVFHCITLLITITLAQIYNILWDNYLILCREILTYTDGNIPLAETDLEKIAKLKSVSIIREEDLINGSKNGNISLDCLEQSDPLKDDVKLSTDGTDAECTRGEGTPHEAGSNAQEAQMALKLGFTLPSSCYATMAIRELLKTSTSVRNQNFLTCQYTSS